MAENTEKVIFDTDIGTDIDDAVALAYLLAQPRCELLGVTTVTGEADLRAEMVSAICRNVDRDDVPIHAGCCDPLIVPQKQTQAAQAEALEDMSRRRGFVIGDAIEFLRQTIRENPGEVTLLATGPFTNLAVLFSVDPEIPALLKQVVIMGGRYFQGMGKEWNASCDPHATASLFSRHRAESPDRLLAHGLDVTLQCVMDAEDVRERFTARVLEPVSRFAEVWFRRQSRIIFHDPLAAVAIFQPELCEYAAGTVEVSLNDPTLGWTVFTEDTDGPHEVATSVDAEAFFAHYFDVVR
ncbi:MAG: nucleoside hydrolase [Phycisphaerae bacterium]